MNVLDIPWLIDREHNMASRSEAINNYYYNDTRRHWYQRRRWFCPVIVVLVAVIVGAVVALSVVLTRSLGGNDGAEMMDGVADGGSALSEDAWKTVTTSISSSGSAGSTSTRQDSPSVTVSTQTSTLSPSPTPSPAPDSISPTSHLTAIFVNRGPVEQYRRVLIWQATDGNLVASEDTRTGNIRFRIADKLPENSLADIKDSTPLASAVDDLGYLHVFYESFQNDIMHVYETASGNWTRSVIMRDDAYVRTHGASKLSAAWHESQGEDGVLVLVYQDPDRGVRLLVTRDPRNPLSWVEVDVMPLLDNPVLGSWDGLGHAVLSGWRPPKMGEDAEDDVRKLLMAVEGDDTVFPWECGIEMPGPEVECSWLNRTFSNSRNQGISLSSPPTQLSWAHTPSSGDFGNATYDISFLVLNADGDVDDHRIGVGMPRKTGTDVDALARDKVDTLVSTPEGTMFARAGEKVLLYHLTETGWRFDGYVNTTLGGRN